MQPGLPFSRLRLGCVVMGLGMLGLSLPVAVCFIDNRILPQAMISAILLAALANIGCGATGRNLHIWKTYVPLMVFIGAALLGIGLVPLWARPLARLYATDPTREPWCRAMVVRAMSGWSAPACELSRDTGVLFGSWSRMTLNERMPVLVWSENGVPSSELPTHPISCELLDARWFYGYLSRPEEISFDRSGLCDLGD